jgi:hypothetical protein
MKNGGEHKARCEIGIMVLIKEIGKDITSES